MQSKHCCAKMAEYVTRDKAHGSDQSAISDSLICHNETAGRYSIRIQDGCDASPSLAFCPWCGAYLTGAAPAGFDWVKLAIRIGSYNPDNEFRKLGGTDYAQKAVSALLGDDLIRDAVDIYLAQGPASELARSILRLLLPRKATEYCLELFQAAQSAQKRDSVLELLRYIADNSVLPWLELFLKDPDRSIRTWGLEMTYNKLDMLDRSELARIASIIQKMPDIEHSTNDTHDDAPNYVSEITKYLAEMDE